MYKSLKDVYESTSLGRYVPMPYIKYTVITEGGAGGHMIHPFDVPGVKTGKDLINIFDKAVKAIQSEQPAVKIDGVNISIKIARNLDGTVAYDTNGEMQFGVDRGAKTNQEDIKGVTIDNLGKRFINKIDPSKPHGLIEASALVLNIFNTALPSIQNDLKKLRFFDKDNQKFFNMEYVYGQTNVVGYDRNFLAIHGVNQVDLKTRNKKEVSYNRAVLEDIIKKVKPIAKQSGFDLYGTIPAELNEDVEVVDFSPALNSELTVMYTPDHAVTKRLDAWLRECNNPSGKTIVLANNKRISPLGLENYNNIINKVPLNTVIKDNNDVMVKDSISGAVFLRSTLLMGQILKSALKSDIGDVAAHEGIVVRNLIYRGKPVGQPVKFTGEFIVGKETGKFAQQDDEDEISGIQTNSYQNPVLPNGGNSLANTPYGVNGGEAGAPSYGNSYK
jgi:hypothetical protein